MTKKISTRTSVPIDLPAAPPKLPEDVKKRFPSLVQWEAEWQRMWESSRSNIRSRDENVESRLTKLENP